MNRADEYTIAELRRHLDDSGTQREFSAAVRIHQLILKHREFLCETKNDMEYWFYLPIFHQATKIVNRGPR